MIRVLIVDDSPVAREFLRHLLDSDPDIEVVGIVNNGEEALKFIERNKPDVITMDINMPGMNGFETTRRIMSTTPVPIIIVTGSWNPREVTTSFHTIEAGALACIERPQGVEHPDHERMKKELLTTVKLMSEVKVVRRWGKSNKIKRTPTPLKVITLEKANDAEIVAIGASSGGPIVLQKILSQLPMDYPVPVLVVLHISRGFIEGFVNWLSETVLLPIKLAKHGEIPSPGHIYFAPDGYHLGVNSKRQIALEKNATHNGLCPLVSNLFSSIANVYGSKAIGALLTGMGRDGADELKLLQEKGALTIAQDKESSLVFGMPGEAVKLGAANYILNPDEIAQLLKNQFDRENK